MTSNLGLEDILADLRHARRQGDLGRMALIAYCDVRRWARQAGEHDIAQTSALMFTEQPHASREHFLERIDTLIFELTQASLDRQSGPGRGSGDRSGASA